MARRLAFVVNSSTNGDLKAGNRDAARIFTVLTDPLLGACSSDSPRPLYTCGGQVAFHESLLALLDDWRSEDQLVFYFSGHGNMMQGEYCLQFGVRRADNVPFSNILKLLKTHGVTRAVVIVDACHSGGALATKSDAELVDLAQQDSIPQGVAILASSRASEKSHELPDGAGSVFTMLFCEGIETALDATATEDGLIGVNDIIDYVARKLRAPEYADYQQRPMYTVNQANRSIWIAKNKAGAAAHRHEASASNAVRTLEELRIAYETTVRTKHPCEGAKVEDVEWSLVDLYTNAAHVQVPHGVSKEQILRQIGLFSPLSLSGQPALHKAAVLCFCERPESHIPQARSVFVVGDPTGDRIERKDVTGPLSRQVSRLVDLIQEHLGTVAAFGEGGLRHDEPELPTRIVREVVSNAIVHRDYDSTGTVQVRVLPDAIEVQSPGSFPNGVTWDTLLKEGGGSYPIDAAIALYMTNLLAFEGVGRGFGVFRQYIANNGPESIKCMPIMSPPTVLIRLARTKPRSQSISGERDPVLAAAAAAAESAMAVGVGISNQPTPNYPDAETRILSEKLAAALARKQRLQQHGADITDAAQEVLDLKRRLREGGQLKPGDALGDGRYLLLDVLGRGGFATVWRAHDGTQDKVVAIKVLHSNLAGDHLRLNRFLRGARIMRELRHEAVVQVSETGAEDAGWHYFVMEFLPGGDMHRAVIDAHLKPEAVFPLVLRIGDALAQAHKMGIVHRDVKPSNILLDATGAPKLTDFDLVVAADTTGGTRTGPIGTFLYAAPEIMNNPQDAGAAADVYGLAMTAVFGMHGDELSAVAIRDINQFVDQIRCSPFAKSVLKQALSWKPADRFVSAGDFCEALQGAIHADEMAEQAALRRLSERQRKIAGLLISSPMSYKEMAKKVETTESTVRKHVETIFRTMRVRSRAELLSLVQNSALEDDANLAAQDKLRELRQRLAKLEHYPWDPVDAWIASAKPLIKTHYRDHFEEFVAVTTTPKWYHAFRVTGGGRWSGPRTNNFDDASAREIRENRKRAAIAKDKILAFVDGLLDPSALPVQAPPALREANHSQPGAYYHQGDVIMGGSKFNTNITGSNIGAFGQGDNVNVTGSLTIGTPGTVTQEQHKAAITQAQTALVQDQDALERIDARLYEALGQFLRMARQVQVEQKQLAEVQAKMKETLDEVWAQQAAKGLWPQALPEGLKVVEALAKSPITAEVARKLLGA